MRSYAEQRGWIVVLEAEEIGSSSIQRPQRERLRKAARRRELDVILVWRLDRWGRSVADLALTLKELNELGVAFVSLTEALDLTTPSGRAIAGPLSVFAEFEREILRERVLAGLAQARKQGTRLGRAPSRTKKRKRVSSLLQACPKQKLHAGFPSLVHLCAVCRREIEANTGCSGAWIWAL